MRSYGAELTWQLIQVRYIGVLYFMYVYKDNKSRPILMNHCSR